MHHIRGIWHCGLNFYKLQVHDDECEAMAVRDAARYLVFLIWQASCRGIGDEFGTGLPECAYMEMWLSCFHECYYRKEGGVVL